MRKIITVAAVAGSALAFAACGGSTTTSTTSAAHKAAARLSPENTAKRLQADYRKRHVPGKVHCVDFDTTTQFCDVTSHGQRVARLKVKLNVQTGAIDAEPIH